MISREEFSRRLVPGVLTAEDVGGDVAVLRLERAQRLHVLVGQTELRALEVRLDALGRHGLGDDAGAALHRPRNEHMSGRGALVLGGDGLDNVVLEECGQWLVGGHVGGSERAVGGEVNALRSAVREQPVLAVVRVQLALVDGGDDAQVLDDFKLRLAEVADADAARELLLVHVDHSLPRLLKRGLRHVVGHRREAVLDGVDGPMHKVEVEVLQLQVREGLGEALGHLVAGVERIPELRRHPQVLALHETRRECLRECLADLGLVLVDGGAVDVTVSALDGGEHGGLDLARLGVPRAQTEERHHNTVVECDGCHHGVKEEKSEKNSFSVV
eukprot:PhM_4_TR4508/c1_g2_i1/m.7741